MHLPDKKLIPMRFTVKTSRISKVNIYYIHKFLLMSRVLFLNFGVLSRKRLIFFLKLFHFARFCDIIRYIIRYK